MLTVERVDNLEGLTALSQPWTQLLSRCSYRNLFLTHEWASTWWTHFGKGKELWLLMVRDGEELLGIAPMMLGWEWYGGLPVRMLGFLVNRHTSRADFIIADGRKEEVIGALVRYWQDHNRCWDVLRLVHVPRESGNVRVLEEAIGMSKLIGFPAKTSKNLCYLPMTGSWEDYLRGRSSHFRKRLKGTIRRARQEGAFEVVREEDPKEVEASMGRLFRLEARSWKSQDSKAVFSAEEKAFAMDIARKFSRSGRVSNIFMTLDGTDVGALYSIVYEGVCYAFLIYYDEKYDKWSPGRYLMAESLSRYWAEGGIREFDFNGDSAFIRSWTNHERVCEVLSAGNAMPYSKLIGRMKRLKRVLWRSGAARGNDNGWDVESAAEPW